MTQVVLPPIHQLINVRGHTKKAAWTYYWACKMWHAGIACKDGLKLKLQKINRINYTAHNKSKILPSSACTGCSESSDTASQEADGWFAEAAWALAAE